MLLDQLDQLGAGCGLLLVAADEVDHVVAQQRAELVERGQLAAALEAGIDRQHALARQRRLQQQVPQVAGEHLDGVRLGLFGQLAARLALQAGQHQPRRARRGRSRSGSPCADARAARAARSPAARSPARRTRSCTRSILARSPRLIASTRCGGMRLQRLAEVEVVVELLILLGVVVDLRARQLARSCGRACGPSAAGRPAR